MVELHALPGGRGVVEGPEVVVRLGPEVLRLQGEELERAGDGGQGVGPLDFVLGEEGRAAECDHNADLSQEHINFALSLYLIRFRITMLDIVCLSDLT